MNLYIFVSKKLHKRFLFGFVAFYCLLLLSFVVFLVFPQAFYYRSWEYFNEFVYKVPDAKPWVGDEAGDNSRDYIFSYQEVRKTHASCDFEGFRSVPFQTDRYPILVVGDSNTWGPSLSDQETIPWVLAETLHIPVFNGGKSHDLLPVVLSNPRVQHTKIIIELVTEHLLDKTLFANDFKMGDPLNRCKDQSVLNVLKVHPKRYFLCLKVLRCLGFWPIFNELTKQNSNEYIIHPDKKYSLPLDEEDVVQSVRAIEKRSKALSDMGYLYVFGIIPCKNRLLSKYKDIEFDRLQSLRNRMLNEKVHFVDIHESFRAAPHQEELFLRTDSHINQNGAALIAETLSRYLNENFREIVQQ
jgi:hypothetical protein